MLLVPAWAPGLTVGDAPVMRPDPGTSIRAGSGDTPAAFVAALHAAAASALVGAARYGSGVLGSALVGVFADGTPWPMGWVIALAGLGSAACAWLLLSAPTAADAEVRPEH